MQGKPEQVYLNNRLRDLFDLRQRGTTNDFFERPALQLA
jgi:hypothetical protein